MNRTGILLSIISLCTVSAAVHAQPRGNPEHPSVKQLQWWGTIQGTGDEPENGRPWAEIWLPRRINPEWFSDDDRLFDLGDANLDGVGDIFAFSWPYMVEYNGGSRLDSLVDALIDITPGTEIGILKRLGNIDGSGRDIIALTAENDNGILAATQVPETEHAGESGMCLSHLYHGSSPAGKREQ